MIIIKYLRYNLKKNKQKFTYSLSDEFFKSKKSNTVELILFGNGKNRDINMKS